MGMFKTLAGKLFAYMYDASEWSVNRNARAFFDRSSTASEDAKVGQYERDILIAQARDLCRNNPIVAGMLTRISDMTLGQGIEPRPTTPDKEWNDRALSMWHAWTKDPEGRGLSSLRELLSLCITGVPIEGGAAILKYADGTIEPIELVRFRAHPEDALNGKCYKTDAHGRITHWCIWGRDENGTLNDRTLARWVKAEHVLIMFKRDRPDQVMPTSKLAAAVNILRDMGELNEYTLRQAKVQAAPAIIHKQADEEDTFPTRRTASKEDPLAELSRAADMPVISTRGDVHTLAPATPSSTYESFQKFNLKLVAMSQSIPLDVLMLWFSDGTYASSKATLTQAHEAILQRQRQLIASILRPLWQWKVANAVARGILPPPPVNADGVPMYDAVDFTLPSYEWMDAQDQTQTEVQQVLLGVCTLRELAQKRGHELEDSLKERAQELNLVSSIAAEYGVDPAQLSSVVMNGGAKPATDASRRSEAKSEGASAK